MTASTQLHDVGSIEPVIENACDTIAPTWPLDRFIAVNPYWGRIGESFLTVDEQLRRLAGSSLFMPAAYYLEAWQSGRIQRQDLSAALAEAGNPTSTEYLIAHLQRIKTQRSSLPLLSDVVDSERDTTHEPAWSDAIMHQITQFCAAYFDQAQADWQPSDHAGLYTAWHHAIVHEHSVTLLMHEPVIRQRARELPADSRELIAHVVNTLGVQSGQLQDFLQVLLMRIGGWASWCAYLRWQARLNETTDDHIVDLLAIRLAWEYLVDDGNRDADSAWLHWQQAWTRHAALHGDGRDHELALWQRALEISYQRPLVQALSDQQSRRGATDRPKVQAVFCIDVRSEVIRRALESVDSTMETRGFAGFFGLPIQYTPLGTNAARPQLPGLLAPAFNTTDSCGSDKADHAVTRARQSRLAATKSWWPFQRLPGCTFTLVETLGLGYVGKLISRSLASPGDMPAPHRQGLSQQEIVHLRPILGADASLEQQASLAEKVLRAMSLTDNFARIVILTGHGSQSANNPHAAGLDCGACCGQTGEINARLLASLLNDPLVREQLAESDIHIPATTHFLPALHNTTTDDVVLYDTDLVPQGHADDLEQLKCSLIQAGERARAERAPSLGLTHLAHKPAALARSLRVRANDWSQTRPEWGLADNAAFIVAPRSRSHGIDLQGRAFLHDYAWQQDEDGSVLELIMTAPMIVTHWINMQYYASTVDNHRYGSGNKILHNVVGGRIGVFEGNGGDLRIGLPLQSLHDGQRWQHTPLRLSVFIDAPRAMIETVINKHETVQQLLNNNWLYLFRMGDEVIETYVDGEWLNAETAHMREAA